MEKKQHKKTISIIQLLLVVVLGIASISNSFAQSRQKLPCLDRRFSIIAHIVKDSLGQPNITEPAITSAISAVNVYFSPICVSFEICEFRYIDNFQYDDLDTATELSELMIKYHENYRINMFMVNSTSIPASFASLGGIANVNGGLICMIKSSGSLTYTHEMGHYFGLPHTFEGSGELVDGSNCSTTGDQICDTPADPYIDGTDGEDYVDANCRFIDMQQDANGDYYTPDVGNIMSYYPSRCKCGFTHDQFWIMANTYLNSNPKMW
jgi:hypothetical protein